MEFRIADTFTDSLARLTGDEQKASKTTAFDLQVNPANPGMKFHRIENAKDSNFWSVRVSSDIRIIVHRTEGNFLLCYVDHHDDAYKWAQRRKLETHPRTGAAQLVEIRETIKEVVVPSYVTEEPEAKPLLFKDIPEPELLAYGVPQEWINDIRLANEDSILEIADHLPAEAAEALLELATGGKPEISPVSPSITDPFRHPDAERRFRVMNNSEDLAKALEYPWDKWITFLHPAQRSLVERSYNGPAKVAGSAGTGKTIVALHRAVYLARIHPEARILLTTFSEPLANNLKSKLRKLIASEPSLAERIEVEALDAVASRLSKNNGMKFRLATEEQIATFIREGSASTTKPFTMRFLQSEWRDIVDAWQITNWDEYRDVKRLGRKTRLPESQRLELWDIFKRVQEQLRDKGLVTESMRYSELASCYEKDTLKPYDFIIIDEAQDLGVAQLRFLAAFGSNEPDKLFFAGDLGQRIFQTPFSWKALGIDIRGRSATLKINYRTSHQIRKQADRLLSPNISDVDGNIETRRGTVSAFNGPVPAVRIFDNDDAEIDAVSQWLTELLADGMQPLEIGIFVRSRKELERAIKVAEHANIPYASLDENSPMEQGRLSIGTMHLAKGLEFKAVAVMACDDEVIPSQERIENLSDEGDLEDIYNTERHLLYVACTRARDVLMVTGTDPSSEFLDDMA